MKSKTDWERVKSLTEEQIQASAKRDTDAPLLTTTQLKNFKRVNPVESIDVKSVRNKLHLSQTQFARYFGVSVRTIQEWEQHRRKPTATARNFLRVIDQQPKAVQKALSGL